MRNVAVVFTGSWPYSAAAEDTFLPQEIAALSQAFERVMIVPILARGSVADIRQGNVTVDRSYSEFRTSPARRVLAVVRGVVDPALWRELAPHALLFLRKPRGLVRTVRTYADAVLAERWSDERLRVVAPSAVAYTWWFEGTTLGLARFGNTHGVPVSTRAHGRDVFEWRHDPPVLPFREPSLREVRRVFAASGASARHMAERYPAHAAKIAPALLGIEDPGVASQPSTDGVFRIVSCSVFAPVKRVDLMARGIAAAGAASPAPRFEWTHVGVGPERDAVESLSRRIMPPNVTHRIVDYTGQGDLYDFYRTRPADVFMNTSASEGTPVAIMEAIAVGLPVIATDVGGNPEIVTPANGIIVGANPEPGEIAAAIGALARDPQRRADMRAASRKHWAEYYSAATNYREFAETIRAS